MRLIVAALSFFIGFFVITSGIAALLPESAPSWLTGVSILMGAALSLYLTNKLVNVQGTNFWSLSKSTQSVEELEQQGLLTSAECSAIRAFQVEELEHEGSHYFIELQDKSVLYLNGRYLHEHEPLEYDDKIVHARDFPCTEFALQRFSDDDTIVGIHCRGPVLEPEIVTPPFSKEDFQDGGAPKDGAIITAYTYDEVKAARLEQRRLARRSG